MKKILLTRSIADLLEKILNFIINNYSLIIISFSFITFISIYYITKLPLKSDFIELLPQNYQSVIYLKKIIEKVEGVGNLSIAFESSNIKASQKIADDLAYELEQNFSDRIRYIDYKIDNIKQYYENNSILFIDYNDLKSIKERIQKKIRAEKLKNNPFYIDFTEDLEKDSELDFSDIKEKYEGKKPKKYESYIDGYYTGEDGRLLAMFIKPKGISTDMKNSKKLIDDIDKTIQKLNPKKYSPDMKYGFAGVFKISLEEYDTIKKDIKGTALLCITLVASVILIYFRKIRPVIFLSLVSIFAVSWTFAITYFTIGYVNTQTAFMGAIIAGTGINYGIILLARYYEEKKGEKKFKEALKISIKKTLVGTTGAAGTTAISFAIFLMAEVKGFSQFGFIGLVGVILMWFLSYTFLPSIVILSEKIWPTKEGSSKSLLNREINFLFTELYLKYYKGLLFIFIIFFIISLGFFLKYLPHSLEYDMSKLRTKSSLESGTAKLDHRISKVLGVSTTPAIILAKDLEEAKEICIALEERKKLEMDKSGIENCRSIHSFIPDRQDEKIEVIKEIKKLLKDNTINLLSKKDKEEIKKFEDKLDVKKVELHDLPKEILRQFTDKEGNIGTFVYVSPRAGHDLWNAENLFRFTNNIRENRLKNGKIIYSSGEAVIFADLLKLIKKDGPITTLASFMGVFIFTFLILKNFKNAVFVVSSLLLGITWMVGLISIFNVKLNFFNFVALPMTFGIAVDYSINVYQRYVQEGKGSIKKAVKSTGGAVILCSLTTIIGYFTLIIGDSLALKSFGELAILGELTCITSAIVALPCFVTLFEKKGWL